MQVSSVTVVACHTLDLLKITPNKPRPGRASVLPMAPKLIFLLLWLPGLQMAVAEADPTRYHKVVTLLSAAPALTFLNALALTHL